MKEFGTKFKRCLAMLLAAVMLLSYSNFGIFAPAHATEATELGNDDPSVKLGVLIKENIDGLSSEEISIITSGYLKADKTYSYQMPSDDDNLISVDEKAGTVTAKKYTDPVYGTEWVPTSFSLTNGTTAIQGYSDLPFMESAGVYTGTYELEETNPGNSFTVEVNYALDLTLSDEDVKAQQEMLDAPYALAQDIALLMYLDAVSVIGDDPELAAQIVAISGGMIKDPTKIYADTILDFLVLDLEQMNNQSAVDLVYQLVPGIEIPYVEEIDFETGELVTSTETLRLGKDGRDAATALYNQKHGEKRALDLAAFLSKHNGASYLELLVKYGDELEAALASNYADIDYLSNLNSSGGLKYISNQMSVMIEEFDALEDDIYEQMNAYLVEYDRTVNSLADLEALIAELEATDDAAYAAINAKLATLDAATKAQLVAMGGPTKVEDAQDLEALKTALINVYTTLITTINNTMAGMDTATKLQLIAAGAPQKITLADTSSYDAFVASGDQDVEDLTKLGTALQTVRANALNVANVRLQNIYSADAAMKAQLQAAGAPAKIETAEDLTKLQTALTTVKASLLAQADAKLQSIYSADAAMKAQLQVAGAPAKIETAEDLTKLQTALTKVEANLLAQADAQLQNIYANAAMKAQLTAAGAPAKIETAEDLTKLQNALTTVKTDLLTQANTELQSLYSADASMKTTLQAAGAPAKIETAEDLTKLQTALATVKTSLLTETNTQLQSIYADATLKAQLTAAGAPEKVQTSADVTKLKNALVSARATLLTTTINKANAELDKLPAIVVTNLGGKVSTEKQLLNLIAKLNTMSSLVGEETVNAMNTAKSTLELLATTIEAVTTAETAVLALESAETSVSTAMTAVETLDSAQATLAAASQAIAMIDSAQATLTTASEAIATIDEAQATLTTASQAIATLDSAIANLNTAKAAVVTIKPYISQVLQAQEQLNTLNNTVLPLLNKVKSGLIQLDEGVAMLKDTKQKLDLLILVMQAFCETVKPVNDAFAADAFNAPKLLKADSDFARLNTLAAGMTKKDHQAKKVLHVTDTVVKYKMDMFDVTVNYTAEVVDPSKTDSTDTIQLVTKTYTVTLTKGANAQDILNEIAAKVDEDAILAGWAIGAEHYDRNTSTLPETLTENTTYNVSYTPKMMDVTYGEGFDGAPAIKVPYGYRMTLPKLEGDVTKEYTYQVNDQKNLDQGTVVTITGATTISREEGAVSAKQYLTDLVVNTNPGMSDTSKAILQNEALNRGQAISIRVPGKDQVIVTFADDALSTTITALPFGSRVGDKNWIAESAVIDGVSVSLIDGVHVETANPGFEKVTVAYKLALTAAALGITDEQLLATMNIPFELVGDYTYQKATLDALSAPAVMALLTQLNNQTIIVEQPSAMTLKEALGKVEDLNGPLELGLGADALAAAKRLYTLIPDAGYIDLYYTLEQYNEQGMIHYYRNEQTYIDQITELNDLLTIVVQDEGFLKLIPENKMSAFEAMQQILKQGATLAEEEHRVNTALINVSSPYLSSLLTSLEAAAAAGVTPYVTVPGEMIWTANVERPGPGKRTVTMTVNFNGAQKPESMLVNFGEELTYAELTAWAKEMAKSLGLSDELAAYYASSYSFSGNVTAGNDLHLTATWTLREYPVYVEGASIGNVTYENRQITLAAHPDSNFQYRYYINNVLYSAGNYTLNLEQFKALTEGNLTITREAINLKEANLIKLIDSMNGAAVLTKDANGEYAIILRVDPAAAQESLTNFVIGMFLTDYKYISLDGSEFYSGQFHMQALLDAIMDSGIGTESLLKLIDANGNITNKLTLADGTDVLNTVAPAYMSNLGGVLLETTMGFGADAQSTTNTKFYITLAGSNAQLTKVRNGLAKAKELGITFVLDNNRANVAVTLPDQAYGAFLAALSLVGEVDIQDLNAVNAQIAMGYLLDLVDPALGESVTTTTLTNTLAKLGYNRDLTAYEKYFQLGKNYYNSKGVSYEESAAVFTLENIGINTVVNKLQSVVDGMDLPEGISVNLAQLVYEYDDPTADDDDAAGLDATAALELTNLATDYAALFLDIRAEGVLNKFGMWTEAELLAASDDFAGASVVVLVDDVTGNLNFNTTTILDLNGKTLNGGITGSANANVIVTDTAYEAAVPGTVTGAVSGNVIILAGKYETDVSANLDNGYQQNAEGVVSNKLYTVVTDDNGNITVTLNATPADVKELASKKGLAELAIEIVASLAVNNYTYAGLSIEGDKIYNISINDAVALYASSNRVNTAIDTGLSWISASDLTDLFNTIVADLTDFAALESALLSDGQILSYTTSVSKWNVELEHVADGDYLTLNVGAAEETKDNQLNVVIDGSLKGELAKLAGALADTVTVNVTANMEEIVRNGNVIDVAGSFNGAVEIDFTHDPNYVIAMAVILADGADAKLKAELVAGIEEFYELNSLFALEKTFKSITVQQFCDSIRSHARSESFTAMVNGLALKDETKQAILSAIDDNEMGFNQVVDVAGFALRQLEARALLETVTDSQRTLGGLEKTDAEGKYFGLTLEKHIIGERNLYRGYKLGYDLDVAEVSVKLRMFLDHVHVYDEIVDPAFLKSEATCTEAAVYYKSCPVCGQINKNETFTYGEPNGHDLVEVVDEKYLKSAANCTEAAVYYKSCSVCGEASDETFTYGEANSHDLVEVVDEKYLKSAANCTEAAVYYKSCSVCGEASDETFVYGEANGHTMKEIVDEKYLKSAATCTEAAVYYKSCSVCGEKSDETFTYGEANGHDLVEVVDEKYLKSGATCTDPAVYHKSCSVCGEASDETFTHGEALGHTIKEIVDEKYLKSGATCTEAAVYYKSCSICGEKSDETFTHGEALGHTIKEIVDEKYLKSAATCTEAAVYYKSCSICGEKSDETFIYGEPNGHDLQHVTPKGASTTTEGNIEYWYCRTCGKYFSDEACTKEITLADTVIAKLPTVGVPAIPVGGNVYGYLADADAGIIYIDAGAAGMTVEEFKNLISAAVTNDVDGKAEIKVEDAYNNGDSDLICTTAKVTLTAENVDGVKAAATYDIVVMGDTNCNGRIESGDGVKVDRHYLGLQTLTGLQLLAADVNRNGRIESGDGVKIDIKFLNAANYTTALKK